MLHNNMLSEMETTDSDAHVGRSGPIDGEGLWLRGENGEFGVEDNKLLAMLWGQQRAQLAKHIKYCAKQTNR
jgi:hypothetical protein